MEVQESQLQIQDECMICLENMQSNDLIGKLPCCPTNHYHKECIEIWSSKSNSCPTCRNRFYKILISLKSKPNSIINSLNIKDKLLPNPAINHIPSQYIINNATQSRHLLSQSNFEDHNSSTPSSDYINNSGFCCLCTITNRRNNSTILCQQCGSNFHLNCLGISDLTEEYFNWFCPMCDYNQETVIPNNHLSLRRRGLLTSSIRRHLSQQPRSQNRRLIIHNDNDELNDDFLYNEDLSDNDMSDEQIIQFNDIRHTSPNSTTQIPEFSRSSSSSNTSNIVNGGILLRREQKQNEKLSIEEVNSWDMFDKARKESIEENQQEHTNALSSSSNSVSNGNERRRRRRKRSAEEDNIDTQLSLTNSTNTLNSTIPQSSSRISNLIDQLKHTKKPHTSATQQNSQYLNQFPQSYINSTLASQSDSSTSIGNSPMESNAYSSDDNEYTRNILVNNNIQPELITRDGSNKQIELTYEQKLKIQKQVRNKLKIRYNPNFKVEEDQATDIITNEEEFIKINKKISRKIYNHILSNQEENVSIDSIIEKNDYLQELIDKYF
ncbi:uncharacterized protein KGF55_000475 [Candida pseudojiufengensis]|uniref:uncharacterized protein n=1 Tax=Candida pseudojiufengensis TaxID=497109 RepID=UPI0022247B06|nr:uncharacterized protein KGF55_000475 [Candida pseudojiufengensis]KAI5966166.1 hypothetical protein KGF55_000475 [Candida pseudojiufengensis]